jgi:hypothetical protein
MEANKKHKPLIAKTGGNVMPYRKRMNSKWTSPLLSYTYKKEAKVAKATNISKTERRIKLGIYTRTLWLHPRKETWFTDIKIIAAEYGIKRGAMYVRYKGEVRKATKLKPLRHVEPRAGYVCLAINEISDTELETLQINHKGIIYDRCKR